MGGSALHVPTERLDAARFHRLAARLCGELSAAFPGVRVEPIPAYRTKADFGDLDLLVERAGPLAQNAPEQLEAWVRTHCHTRDWVPNGDVLSFDLRDRATDEVGFQVDLILTPSHEFDVGLSYFAYNDLGNLIGRVAHKMGFSHGHRGLLYPMRDGTHQFRVLDMSQDVDVILPFLGFQAERFHRGFDTLDEIFQYVVTSPYFNRDIYLLENRNHQSRVRDRKRPTYNKFLNWIENQSGLPAYPWADREDEPARAAEKAHFLELARARFPGFAENLDRAYLDLADARLIRAEFSGARVGAWTGLSNKDLGAFMATFRQQHPDPQAFAAWLRKTPVETLEAEVRALYARQSEPRAGAPSGPSRRFQP